MDQQRDREAVGKIIVKSFYAVYNALGYGFLERNYENALVIELRSQGLQVESQAPIEVFYRGQSVGRYLADLWIEDLVICELKANEHLTLEHEAQLLNYLRATDIELGYLLNFGLKPEIKRRVFDNNRKSR